MSEIEAHFLALGDRIKITPLQGRSQNIILNRTRYEVYLRKGGFCGLEGCSLILPTLGEARLLGSLDLVNERYRARFREVVRINGAWAFEFFLSKGMEIGHEYNKITHCRSRSDGGGAVGEIPEAFLKSSLPILLEGETGTGKSSLALKIHQYEGRSGRFVHLNIADYPEGLVESELFGHRKGSFTGATNDKVGALRLAHRGTLFLDEIDSLPLALQAKLLLFLDDYSYRPVGATEKEKVSVRLIVASGTNLSNLVEEGRMRSDFYFRVSAGLALRLPALREDRSLMTRMLESYEIKYGVTISGGYKRFLMDCEWPGNLRQLEGHLRLKSLLNPGGILVHDHLDERLENAPSLQVNQGAQIISLEEMKRRHITKAWRTVGCSAGKAASLLKISANTVRQYVTCNND